MTRIKLCGITRECDIKAVNELQPEYIGFVFARKSRRYVTPDKATLLRQMLSPGIKVVGVFVDEPVENVAKLLWQNIIDVVQLHGNEDEGYIESLRRLTDKPVIKAFCITTADDIMSIDNCSADYLLLDSGAGSGETFDWDLINNVKRPFFLAGGLNAENVQAAVKELKPFAVDVSSGIETDGLKDEAKMKAFVANVREL